MIETNVRQRGDISSSSLKMKRIIDELERIYGVQRGRPELNKTNGRNYSQENIATQLGISVKDLQRYKKLSDLIPELQEMVDDQSLFMSVASRVLARLSKEEQNKLIDEIGKERIAEMTQKQMQEFINSNNKKNT